jgi:hypothetical protein
VGFEPTIPVREVEDSSEEDWDGSGGIDSRAHPDSCSLGTGSVSPRTKRPEREADHYSPCSVENGGAVLLLIYVYGIVLN